MLKTVFVISYLSSVILHLMGSNLLAMACGIPALFLAGWAFLGHFVTLDDDFPGGWSNQNGEKIIWYKSLGEFFAKMAVFIVLLGLVYL
jgi:hypothetical protein